MVALRLGDDVDDYCIKCKRVTNHSILSLVDGDPAKVRCRTCYNEGPFRNCEVPPSKKDLKKAALFNEVLGSVTATTQSLPEAPADGQAAKPATKKGRKA
jgi:hypothetical protein